MGFSHKKYVNLMDYKNTGKVDHNRLAANKMTLLLNVLSLLYFSMRGDVLKRFS